MGLIDKLTGKAKRDAAEVEARLQAEEEAAAKALKDRAAAERKAKREAKKAEKAAKSVNLDKEAATANGEPYVNIVGVELDPNNVGNGAFELDWNEFFVAKLVRAGYKGKDDAQIVDQWFQDVCRHVVLETYEQYEANNPRPQTGVQRRDLGDGYSEVS